MQDDTQKPSTSAPEEVTEETVEETSPARPPITSMDNIKAADEESDEMEIEEDAAIDGDDAETVTEDSEEAESEDSDSTEGDAGNADTQTALSIMQIENMINTQIAEIDKTRDDVKMLKSSFDDAFKNDAKYREFDEKVKEVAKLKKTYVDAMKKDPSIQKAEQDFINRRDELKDLQLGLSDYLKEYNRVSGMSQFETQDGQVLKIVQTFKLVKS